MRVAIWLGAVVLVAAGCGGGPGQAEVSGTVRFEGRPLASGTVTFVGADGAKSHSGIGPNGEYRVQGVARGMAQIGVVSHPRVPAGLMKPGPGQPAAKSEPGPAVPARYGDPAASGLSCDVSAAAQTHDIELAR